MEKLNLDFSDKFSTVKSILWILSILSWLFFLSTGFSSIKYLVSDNIIWTIIAITKDKQIYYPLQINISLIYIIFITTMVIATLGFSFYVIKSIFKKDDEFFDNMMDIWSRLHSFPLIVISCLFLLGEYFYPVNKKRGKDNVIGFKEFFNNEKDICIAGLTFSLIALISLIFVYIITDIKKSSWYVVLTIKKGTYSCLIVLLWYYFIYAIYQVNDFNYGEMSMKGRQKWNKCYSSIFSIVFGAANLSFSYFFKDLVISFMNFFIYLGMIIYFFSLEKAERRLKNNICGDGIIDITMIVLSSLMIAFLFFKHRGLCFC